jgi:hypothetical protein
MACRNSQVQLNLLQSMQKHLPKRRKLLSKAPMEEEWRQRHGELLIDADGNANYVQQVTAEGKENATPAVHES